LLHGLASSRPRGLDHSEAPVAVIDGLTQVHDGAGCPGLLLVGVLEHDRAPLLPPLVGVQDPVRRRNLLAERYQDQVAPVDLLLGVEPVVGLHLSTSPASPCRAGSCRRCPSSRPSSSSGAASASPCSGSWTLASSSAWARTPG